MSSMPASKTVAILVSNGFDEHQMAEVQRALTRIKALTKTVAPEQGVVNGWQGDSWGHYFPVDANIGAALGSDFDVLILPGGERGVERLKANAHARRIINHFLEAKKPVAAIGAGVSLLALSGSLVGRIVAAPAQSREVLESAGATVVEDSQVIDGCLVTSDGADLASFVDEVLAFIDDVELTQEAA